MDIKGVRGHRAIKPQLVGRRIPVTGNKIVMGYTDDGFPTQPHWIVIAINIFAVFNIAPQRDQDLLSMVFDQPRGVHGMPVIRMLDLLVILKGLAKKTIFVFDAMPGCGNIKGGHRIDKTGG